MSKTAPLVRAGDTVTHPSFALTQPPKPVVIVEVWPDGSAELDNGHCLPAHTLVPVLTGEQWVPVAGFEGRYWVSSHGHVLSTGYYRTQRTRLLRVLAPHRYPAVTLSHNGERIRIGINRLVAQHFLPSPAQVRCTFVLPRDGNHLNLRAENLEWVDPCEVGDADVAARLHPRGEQHPNSRLTSAQVEQVRELAAQGTPFPALAQQFNVSRPAIFQIVHRQFRRHG